LKSPELNSERLVFKPLSIKHCVHEYVSWMNDPEVYRCLESGLNYSIELLYDFLIDVENKNIYFWAIHLKSNNKHIGNIKIDPISTNNLVGEYGILLGDKSEWGKGYAAESSLAIIKFCFEIIGLRKVTLGVVADNTAAVALYKKIGFQQEGYYKIHSCCSGIFYDVIRMAIFNKYLLEN